MNQKVLVRDFRPHCPTKWYQIIVLKCLGPLTYEVLMEGKPRSVHVDHLQPWVDEIRESNTVTNDQVTLNVTPDMTNQDEAEAEPMISPENNETSDAPPHIR